MPIATPSDGRGTIEKFAFPWPTAASRRSIYDFWRLRDLVLVVAVGFISRFMRLSRLTTLNKACPECAGERRLREIHFSSETLYVWRVREKNLLSNGERLDPRLRAPTSGTGAIRLGRVSAIRPKNT